MQKILRKIVIMSGDALNEHGMPKPYKYFGVICSAYQGSENDFNVSVSAFSEDAQGESTIKLECDMPSIEIAMEKTLTELRNRASTENLRYEECDLPEYKWS
jgi:hypothetical protein